MGFLLPQRWRGPPSLRLRGDSGTKATRARYLVLPKVNEALLEVFAEQLPSGHRWLLLLAISKDPCSCKGAHQAVALQWLCWHRAVLPPAAEHDGDDHGNVDVHKLVLVGNCTLFQLVLQWLQPLGHLRQICLRTRLRPLSDFLRCTAQASANDMSSVKATSSEGSHDALVIRVSYWNATSLPRFAESSGWMVLLLSSEPGCCPTQVRT